MNVTIGKRTWQVSLSTEDHGLMFESGLFGGFSLLPSPLFRMKLEGAEGEVREIDSAEGWGHIRLVCSGELVKFWLSDPNEARGIAVTVTGSVDEGGISWTVDVGNDSDRWSVTEITYPMPVVEGDPLHLFIPDCCGRAVMDAGKRGFGGAWDYPGHNMSMQYFAFWGEREGAYFGVHDPGASMKRFTVEAGEGRGTVRIGYTAPGAGEVSNSFTAAGCLRWEVFSGDWYDAAMIYADFVHSHAAWFPIKGRPDTPEQFKKIAFWICDYIPNSEKQMDARPMTLAADSERYGKDYWTDAAIALKERLGVPAAYQVYNWHEIPFNINYPHFLPARQEAKRGFAKLRDAGLYVFPYINAVSWEMDDREEGFTENFSNTGIRGAAISQDGKPYFVHYPQKKASGRETRLGVMCPSFPRWHEIMETVTRGIEEELPVDGIYFDQIAAVPSYPCRSREHSHRPGGGSWWSGDFGRMMEKINAKRPENRFYYSESNAEAYVKYFDGFLTWVWTMGDAVPAFPAVYAGYTQMIGRYTDGAKRDDDAYFRYHLAESLLFGQQLGWLNAHVVYNEERMRFLEKVVQTRVKYTDLFNEGKLMRPPKVETDLPPVASSGITMRQVLAGVWQTEDGERTILFAANVSNKPAEASVRLYPREYGALCPEELNLSLEPETILVCEYRRRDGGTASA